MTYNPQPVDTTSPTPLPMSSVVPDGTNTPLAVEGGPSVTTGGNTNAPAAVYQYDGYSVSFGAKADAAATTDAGTFTFMALFKRLLGKLLVGQQTMAASVGVAIASDQTPQTSATATRSNVAGAASDTSLLASNTARKGAIFFNDSTAILYLAYGAAAASLTSYSVQVPANGFFEMPPQPVYTGAIRGIWSAANGNVRISELS